MLKCFCEVVTTLEMAQLYWSDMRGSLKHCDVKPGPPCTSDEGGGNIPLRDVGRPARATRVPVLG